jgi:hypothetical protein
MTEPSLQLTDRAEIDITIDLKTRPRRHRSPEVERRALAALVRTMADDPERMLQQLADVALGLCQADAAGISLLEGDIFRWAAVAGSYASHRDNLLPRDQIPCGLCLEHNASLLVHLPDRVYPMLRGEPRIVEALLIPFHQQGRPAGTVWVVMHDEWRKFDGEDERILQLLGHLASAGWQLWKAYEQEKVAGRRKDDLLARVLAAVEPVRKDALHPNVIERRVSELLSLREEVFGDPRD